MKLAWLIQISKNEEKNEKKKKIEKISRFPNQIAF